MLTNNFEYMVPVLFLLFALAGCFGILWHMRRKYLTKLCKINILKKQQRLEETFYIDDLLRKIVLRLMRLKSRHKSSALANLAVGRTDKAEHLLQVKYEAESLFLSAHVNSLRAYSALKKKTKIWSNRAEYSVYFAVLAEKFFDFANVQRALKKIKPDRLRGKIRAYYNLVAAGQYLREADMLSASQNASYALKFFQKHNMPIEEAQTYLLLAEIYRISCVNDVAQTMIESAIKIYKQHRLPQFLARSTAVLGMLMLFENRYEEAEDKFLEASKLSETMQTTAEIMNQQALLYIANKSKKQLLTAQRAYKLHKQCKNPRGEALSLQLLGQIYAEKGKWQKVCGYARKAQVLYQKQKNFSAVCESLYLEACALYRLEKYSKSEDNLRKILDVSKRYPHNFHYANAYSLLGLIYMKTGDLQRAKVLFQQSLGLEQTNSRSQGMVADYVDLAMIEQLRGDDISARSNLQTALEYAKQTEDEKLIKLIEKKL